MADIFVSYTESDREWAFWIGQELAKLSHTPRIHDWEVPGGGDIMEWMEKRLQSADRVLCIVSDAYLNAAHSTWERRVAQWASQSQRPNFMLPVFIEDCEVPISLAHIKRCRLYGLGEDEDEASARLRAFLTEPGRAGLARFPGDRSAVPRTPPRKPLIFVSYAHQDEPHQPRGGETQWLRFVMKFLQPAAKSFEFMIWEDRQAPGGTNWDEEIERHLRACDVFVLLVSANSMTSDGVVDREIDIISERRKAGEDVHFYPLLLDWTPRAGLERIKDQNLRPRDARPFASLSARERSRHMAEATDEIMAIASKIAASRR